MQIHTADPTSLSLKHILVPVAGDIVKIDETLRSLATLDSPLLRGGIEALIAAGGKRLRPAVLFLAAKFNQYDRERLVPMAAAIELLHTASLVHDDTIDNALMRRGLPTLNSILDEGTTVLVGDYLFAKSAVLSTMGGMLRATRIFAECLVTMTEGEIEQKFATHHLNSSVDAYYKRIYAKTGVLFAAAGELGAVLSDAPEDEIQRLRHYGRQVGMAFQIIDDILDIEATANQLGKPVGGDLRQGNVTLPVMFYLEQADAAGRGLVSQVIEGDRSEQMIHASIELITNSPAVERAYTVAKSFAEEAKSAIALFDDAPARRSLLDLADFVVQRDF